MSIRRDEKSFNGAHSVQEICRNWDGKKVWVLIDDMWRQGTVVACGPVGDPSSTWDFVIQSKIDGYRYVVSCKPTENGEFDNIEATEHIDIPLASVDNVRLAFDSLPPESPNVELGSYKCPIHPYVAEYIKRLLFQLEMQAGEGHMKALVAADAENSRLRMALEASNNALAAQGTNYEKYIAEVLEEVKTLNDHNVALAQAAAGNPTAHDFQTVLANLHAENRKLSDENRNLRNDLASKAQTAPNYQELEALHAELARLRGNKAGGGDSNTLASLRSGNDALLDEARLCAKRVLELSHRILKYEGNALEAGRPAFDYNSSTDTTKMFNKVADECNRLEAKVTQLEGSLKINPKTGTGPNTPLQGSFAEQIVQLRQQLIQLQARIDALTGTIDPNTQVVSRLAELEFERNELQKLLAVAAEEREAMHLYLDRTVQPVLNENDQLRSELHAKAEQLMAVEASTKSKGLFW